MSSIKTFNPTTEHMGKGLKRDIWVLAGCWATVLTASTAFAGPEAAVGAQSFPWLGLNARYSGCFLLVAVANLINYALIACVRFAPVEAPSEKETPTPLREIFGKPDSICAVSVATVASRVSSSTV